MAARLARLTYKIAKQLHLLAESYTICSSRSRPLVRKLLDRYLSNTAILRFVPGCTHWLKVVDPSIVDSSSASGVPVACVQVGLWV